MSQTACRFCGAPVEAVFADLGMSPLANSYLPPERVERDGALLSAARARLRQLLPRAARGVRDARADLLRLRLLLVLLLELARAQPPLRRADDRAARPGRATATSSRSPPTTATCCSSSTSARSPCSASSRRPTSRRSRSQKGIPTLVEFFGRETASSLAGESAADLLLGNNVLAHVPDLNDFVAGMKILLEARRRDHDGVPASDAPDRGQPVGHDLPRALLLLLVPHRQPRLRGARPAPVRRRGAAHARRLAARSTAATPTIRRSPRPSAARELRERERAAGYEQLETYLGYGRRVEADKRQILGFLIDLKDAGPAHRRLRRPGQGQHAAQLLRRAARLHRLHRAI